ncbi:MAG: NAD-dependent epimerase/dehydratase family protein [Acidobacteriota bacterium]
MKKALITGGAGFLGLHLARRLLNRGVEVELLDDFSRGRRDADLDVVASMPGARLRTVDLLAGEDGLGDLGDDADVVIHLAARLGVERVSSWPRETLLDNLEMTRTALTLAERQTDLTRFIFASTSEVYAGTLESGRLAIPTPEDSPLELAPLARPRTSYALSKLAGEALSAWSPAPTTVVRPHNLYGPRMGRAHVVPQLLERMVAADEGGTLEIHSAEHTRTFCFVDDAVDQVLALAESPTAVGETVNVGAPEPEIRMLDLARRLRALVGKDVRLVPASPTAGSPPRRRADLSRFVALTGRQPSRVDLDDGLARTAAWYLPRLRSGG